VVEQRLHDGPGLLDAVLAGEELAVAGQRGVRQPVGAENPVTSCDLGIFVDQAT
jgi:hypothetical protein